MSKELKIKNIENMALYYLERFPTSKGHFIKVMQRKIKRKCEKKDIPFTSDYFKLLDEVAKKMESYGYIDDSRYINAVIKSSLSKGQSLKKIQAKLFSKSIDSNVISNAIESYADEQDINLEITAGVKFLRKKKIGCFAQSDDAGYETKQKWLQKLAMAGFNYTTANRLLEMDSQEAETILDQTF